MGTDIELKLFHPDPAQADRLLAESVSLIASYEKIFSANDPSSELMRINQQAYYEPQIASGELFELISYAKQASLQSGRRLNLCIGPLVKLWHIGFADARVPDPRAIADRLKLTNPEDLILDERYRRVSFTKPGMEIDLGCLAKGYIADRIRDYWVQAGVSRGLIDLGGNIHSLHMPVDGSSKGFVVGIQTPEALRGRTSLALRVANESVVTSGLYERKLIVGDRSYPHILSSETGYPIETDIMSISIVDGSSLKAEMLSSSLIVESAEHAARYMIAEDIRGLIITKDGEYFSHGIELISETMSAIEEAKLVFEGLNDIRNNNLYDGEEVMEELRKKYGV